MQKRAWFGKREEAASTGQDVATEAKSHACKSCAKMEGVTPFKQCSGCKTVRYCSRECQQKHWKNHRILCQAISSLAKQKYREDRGKAGEFVSHLSPHEHARVVGLVRRKCTVKCLLHGIEAEDLWDTGAQVSIISHNWVRQNLPGYDVRDISELLSMA